MDIVDAFVVNYINGRVDRRDGWLYCPLHNTWMLPPDATHEGHPEYDGADGGCQLVDPMKALRFLLGVS